MERNRVNGGRGTGRGRVGGYLRDFGCVLIVIRRLARLEEVCHGAVVICQARSNLRRAVPVRVSRPGVSHVVLLRLERGVELAAELAISNLVLQVDVRRLRRVTTGHARAVRRCRKLRLHLGGLPVLRCAPIGVGVLPGDRNSLMRHLLGDEVDDLIALLADFAIAPLTIPFCDVLLAH